MRRSSLTAVHLLLAGLLAVFGATIELQAQQVTVQGRVVNEASEEPIQGATVTVPGTDQGAVTDAQGQFTLTVPNANAVLRVSHLGFAPGEVPLNGRTTVVLRLTESAIALEEVVVVGYGTQEVQDVTGSVASVSSRVLEEKATTSVEQALQGAVPGVAITIPGGGAEPRASFQIRGQNSITASNEPLIVIDGIPYTGPITEINQGDIASISILKDASAAAIYGARGSNGVVLITTKKGGGAPRFSYNGHAGVQQIAELPRLMTGAEFAAFKCERLSGGQDCGSALTLTEQENLAAGRFVDWLELATRQGFQQQHNLSFTGGSEVIRYYISGSSHNVSGVARNDEFDRYTLQLNLDSDIKDWLRMGTSTRMSYTDRGGMDANFESAFFMNPLTNAYNEDGSLSVTPWPEDVFWANPLQGLLVTDDDITRRIFTSNFVEVDLPVEGLSYRFNAGIDYANGRSGRYYGRNTRTGLDALGRASTSDDIRFDWTAENLARFNRAFGEHEVDLTGLFSVQGINTESRGISSEGFPNDVLTYYQAHLGALVVPSQSVSTSRIVSQMARLNYDYAGRYLLTLTARRDGFSGFGENYKYGVFPSIAVAWNVSNESFFPGASTLNSLKLRASWGENGNQAISPYRTLARLDDQSFLENGATAPGFMPATVGNPNLRWETSRTVNLGTDFGLWNDRLAGSLDVYRTTTTDLLLNRSISPVHGIPSNQVTENVGEVENRGVELTLASLNVDLPDFTWTTDFNISANRNEIVDLYGNGQDDVGSRWFIGQPINVTYDYRFGGIFQSAEEVQAHTTTLEDGTVKVLQPSAVPGDVRIADLNQDGQINADDRTLLGSLEPDYIVGLTNTFRYKGLSLNAFLYGVQGIVRENGLLGMNLVHTEVRRNTVWQDFWTPEDPSDIIPRNSDDSNALSVPFMRDASFIRLKDVTLSYDLPSPVTGRFGASSVRLYVSGRNLWTHSDWEGMDPEFSNSSQRGVPLERVFVGGVDVQF